MTLAVEFDRLGFTIVESVLSPHQIASTIAHLDSISLDYPLDRLRQRAGTRNLLDYAWCVELVAGLRSHSTIAQLLPCNSD